MPQWIETSTSDAGRCQKTIENSSWMAMSLRQSNLSGSSPWVEFDLKGGGEAPEIDRIDLYLRKIYNDRLAGSWTYTVSGSDDSVTWKEVGRASGSAVARHAGFRAELYGDDLISGACQISFVSCAVCGCECAYVGSGRTWALR